MKTRTKNFLWGLIAGIVLLPFVVLAHEAYVVPKDFFWREIAKPIDPQAFIVALKNPHDVVIAFQVILGVLIVIFLNFLFRQTRLGTKTSEFFERFSFLGPLFVRFAIAAAFFFGALSGAFLGPELSIANMPFAESMRWGIYLSSIMIAFGFFTEVAAFMGLVIFSVGFFVFGAYLITYLNYLGELIVLALFGMRRWSFDGIFFGKLTAWRARWEPYETTIVRVAYAIALMFAGITVKFLHPDLSLRVVTDWHLTQFHWLFPSDPYLIVLGAGLAEAAIGFFILVGFEMRMTVFITLFYITLSLIYFQELVWPHILLYGISLNLIVQPEILTLDHILFERHREEKSIIQRILSPHRRAIKNGTNVSRAHSERANIVA